MSEGTRLDRLVGRKFKIGECLLYAGRRNTPCAYLERLVDLPVMLPLMGRSGINCRVLAGGQLNLGDDVIASE
ncbi:hypothetical protein [Rhodococcus sp. PvR099]|uniref:hypothetical protein n=1 Tax=Rhodococcus sp. PvR099 TaxID=2806602 RepID=UPI0035A92B01